MELLPIPSLPSADLSLSLLRKLNDEFGPLIERRGYRVLSLSELCCCGDGFQSVSWGYRISTDFEDDNKLGFNECTDAAGGSVHRIHVRLRRPRSHGAFLPWNEVVHTMAHELAHCVHRDHSPAFHALMEEILDQHASFLVNGVVADGEGFPVGSADAHALGGRRDMRRTTELGKVALERERRAAGKHWTPPQRLGGSEITVETAEGFGGRRKKGGRRRREMRRRKLVREAAARAAEARLLAQTQVQAFEQCEVKDGCCSCDGGQCCQPASGTVSRGAISTDGPRDGAEGGEGGLCAAASSVSLEEGECASSGSAAAAAEGMPTVNDGSKEGGDDSRSCPACTYANPSSAVRCRMCNSAILAVSEHDDGICARLLEEEDERVALALARAEEEEWTREASFHAAAGEVDLSLAQFGYNIYGSDRRRLIGRLNAGRATGDEVRLAESAH